MKNFLQMTLASFIGICIGLLGFTLFMFIIIGAFISMGDQPIKVEKNTILKISLESPIVDQQSGTLFEEFDLLNMQSQSSNRLYDMLKAIEKAAEDPRIKGIYMDLSEISVSPGAAEEVRNALSEFKNSGKFIISYADNYSQLGYYFATVADNVYLNPYGSAMLKGLSSEVMFFKHTLEKLGVEMQIIRHGKFKSAVEPFIGDKMSSENREQILAYTGSIWNYLMTEISAARNISVDTLNMLTNTLALNNAENALKNRLIDDILYKDEVIAKLCEYVGVEKEENLNLLDISQYAKTVTQAVKTKNRIAIIYATGEIANGTGNSGVMSNTVSRIIRQARNDESIKAIVFRVNSPGGDAQASEIIARELELAAMEKPVIISMGSLAASGGYWISTPGSIIVANHTTLTGSIGVFGMIPNIQKGLNNLTGITIDVAKTNDHADLQSIYRPMTAAEKDLYQREVENIYEKFVAKVVNSREMTAEEVDNIGQGRVWSGVDAVENGLVDGFGGLTKAIQLAAEQAYLSDYRIVEMPQRRSAFEELVSNFINSKIMTEQSNDLKKVAEKYEYLKSMVTQPGIKARMTYDVELH